MKKVIITILTVVAVVGVVTGAVCIYNSTYPDSYIEETFPDAELRGKEVYDGTHGLFNSTAGYTFLKYTMYDPLYDVEFEIEFDRKVTRPYYKLDEISERNYYNRIEHINKHSVIKNQITAIVEEKYLSFLIVDNPCDALNSLTDYGFHIYIGKLTTSDLANLTIVLDDFITAQQRENGNYIEYCLNICMDDEILNRIKAADFSKADTGELSVGQVYFTDMLEVSLGCDITRITSSNNGFDRAVYENCGDSSDDEYQSPENFKHLIFWYDSEPNSAFSGSDFYLFGIN